jgi:hypothetical protein
VELAPFLCAIFLEVLYARQLLDAGDLDAGQFLTVTLANLVTGLVLELLDNDLWTAFVVQNLSNDLDLLKRLGVVSDLVAIDEQNWSELNIAVLVCCDAVENDNSADLYLLLPPTGAHNCVNHF